MIKISDGQLGTREFLSIVLVAIAIKSADTTPDLLIFSGKNASWIQPILMWAIIMVPLMFLLLLIKKYKLGMIELVENIFGKWLGLCINIVIFMVLIIGSAVNSRSYIDIVNTMFFPKTPVPFQYFLFMVFCYLIAKMGLETIGRTGWLIVPSIYAVQLLLIIFVWQDMDWTRLFPIAGPGVSTLVFDSLTHNAIYVEIFFLSIAFVNVRNYKDYKFSTLIGFTASALTIAFFCALYIAVYDYPYVESLNYPYQQLIRIAKGGASLEHIESVFATFWVMLSVIHFAIYLYFGDLLLSKLLKIQPKRYLLLPITWFVVLAGLIPDNVVVLSGYRDTLLHYVSIFFVVIPILLYVVDRLRGGIRSEPSRE